ncbi:MAG: prepilin-type N-terminal cleavage/methylation domain-containing protein [Elusimicrobia bacterium]|nr:prepilin-type N-terminal cleavage/methylation domain-containing protein [Elusimicrobiota bacterium]
MKYKRGFTMMEMLVVFILIAVLAQVAIVTYRNSIQDSKRDHAKAMLQEIAIANQRFRTDYPSVNIKTDVISHTPSATCNINKFDAASVDPSILVACGYLEQKTWDNYDYQFYVCGDSTNPCGPDGLAYMVALEGAGKYYNAGVNSDTCVFTSGSGYNNCQ